MAQAKLFIKELFKLNYDYVLNAINWRLPNWLFVYVHTLLAKNISPILQSAELPDFFQRFATFEDADLLEKAGVDKQLLKERLEHNDKCFIIGKDEKVLCMFWGSPGKRYARYGGTIIDPGENGCILYGAFTDVSMRNKGLYRVACKELYAAFERDGVTEFYGAILVMNQNSREIHARKNFKIVGETYHLALFGIKFTYYHHWPYPTRKLHIFIKTPPKGLYWN